MGIPSQGNELLSQKYRRAWFQPGGAGQANALLYAGQDMSYLRIEGVNQTNLGDVTGQYIHDPDVRGAYKLVNTMISPPSLSQADLVLVEKKGGIPRQFLGTQCKFNVYETVGICGDPSDFNGGWDQYVLIYPGGVITKSDYGDRVTFEDDKSNESKLSVTFTRNIYAAGSMAFGTSTTDLATIPARDITYGRQYQCSDCGTPNNGTKWLYAATEGQAATKPQIKYSTDYGATWTLLGIAAATNDEDIVAVAVVGGQLLCLSKTAGGVTTGGYYLSDINQSTGVPGTPVKVTAGFLAASGPNDVYVAAPNEVWFCADGGYIYKSTNLAAGVTVNNAAAASTANLLRIDGNGEIMVITGATSTILVSPNKGATWAATTSVPTGGGVNYQALSVNSLKNFWVGTGAGQLWATYNGGDSWTQSSLAADADITAVHDVVWATPEIGYCSGATVTPTARLYFTIDGGQSWSRSGSRLKGMPAAYTRFTRLAVPLVTDTLLKANNLAIAGLAGAATDGAVIIGSAAII